MRKSFCVQKSDLGGMSMTPTTTYREVSLHHHLLRGMNHLLRGMSLHHHLLSETASKKLAREIEIAPRYFARLDEAVFQAGKTVQAGQHAHYIDLFAYLLRLQWWGILSEQVQSAE